jgi:hypothetical protein
VVQQLVLVLGVQLVVPMRPANAPSLLKIRTSPSTVLGSLTLHPNPNTANP